MSPVLPSELAGGPPRDPSSAPHLFARGGAIVTAAFTAAILVPLAVIGGVVVLAGTEQVVTAAILSGVVGLALASAGVGMAVQRSRARGLFRDGVVAMGRVAAIRPAAGNRNAYVFVDVEYGGRVGTALANSSNAALDLAVGQEVPVLHLPNEPQRFAVFSRNLGLLAGVAKTGR